MYTRAAVFRPYLVRVSIPDLNIRKDSGTDYGKTGKYPGTGNAGTFTIVEEADGEGASRWGLLKSYQEKRNGLFCVMGSFHPGSLCMSEKHGLDSSSVQSEKPSR